MALDGIVTRAIVHELQSLQGARINKIHQPTGNDIVFQIRAQRGNRKLILSVNPTYPRVQFTEQSFMNPQEAPMFCMLLRKHCEGAIIESIEQVGMERVIHFNVRQRDELGDVSFKRLIIEIMGRHSNMIVIDPATNTILDGIHHITPAISSYRVIMPGFSYVEPPDQHKLNPLETSEQQFMEKHRENIDPPARFLLNTFSGLSPLIAEEIVYRAQQADISANGENENTYPDVPYIWQAFSSLMEQVSKGEFAPVSGLNAQGKIVFSAVPLTLIQEEEKHYDSISQCIEAYYGDKAERDTVKQKTSDLLRFLQNERSKNIKKLDNLQKDIKEAEGAEKFRIQGELLFASLHELKRGDKQIELINFYDEEQRPITITLDPQLTPSDNAQRYFKRYNKYKNSLAVIDQQLIKTHAEIQYLDSLLQQLGSASLQDIDEIREELAEQGYVRNRNKRAKKKRKDNRPTLHVYTSSEGIEMYVGKNNLQNDYITNKLAHSNDTWLHTKDIPGSHVVIRNQQFGEATLAEAAQLAAYFSQAKESSSVPVDYTLIRHVRKPSGAKPGFVIYEQQTTLFITPEEEVVKSLESTIKS
ncbi:NFACT RNA binding domain-containing protein [Paenibacillus sp. KACC 21273]|uniref:Rqc2 family fibronectin-binding protein n=1 Tax=Paenibacillus sp. KACC 21273 TaxID=3025665 RepID=UPI00236711C5|nr:NFACT RNA binding domain-containing protein [Paenibacillus sp. KACC 21273]WDF52374.1 NFACT RNA binding domain-containing protein [Paenibacillus sp. KACC 21273]